MESKIEQFWAGFRKEAAIKIPKFFPRMPKAPGVKPLASPEMPLEVRRMSENVAKPARNIKPATEALDYSKMNSIAKVPENQAGTLEYGSFGAQSYKKPPKPSQS
jgi:hypothetical protein